MNPVIGQQAYWHIAALVPWVR